MNSIQGSGTVSGSYGDAGALRALRRGPDLDYGQTNTPCTE